MKKGFTLIELLGTIILLGVIALIIFPIANGAIKESKEKAYQVQVSAIIDASNKWGVDNTHLLPEADTAVVYNLTLDNLVTGGYIEDSKDIKDPRTNEVMDGCISIKYSSNNNQYIYEYKEKDYCDNLPPQVAITINGQKNEKGWLNEDFYVLISGYGDTFKYCMTIDSECTPNVEITNNVLGTKSLFINTETQFSDTEPKVAVPTHICAQSYRGEEASDVECVNYKFDKTDPHLDLYKICGYQKTFYDNGEVIGSSKVGCGKNGWFNQPLTINLLKEDDLSGIVNDKTLLTTLNNQILMSNSEDILYGDVNGDGEVNAIDSVVLAQYLAGFDVTVNALADITRDGKTNYIDETILHRYLAGWSTIFPYYTINENGKDMSIKVETIDNAGNKVIENINVNIDTNEPTVPEITGGGEFENVQIISIKTPSTDALSGLDYYEYYICNKNNEPNVLTKPTGITKNEVVINQNYEDYRIYYRAVDNAGNKSAWSEPEEVNVNKTMGDFNFAINEYGTLDIVNIDLPDNYIIKYLKGNKEATEVINSGENITESNGFNVLYNDIYTVTAYLDGAELLTKKIYIYNSTYLESPNIMLSDIIKIGNVLTYGATVTASLSDSTLTIDVTDATTHCDGSDFTIDHPDEAPTSWLDPIDYEAGDGMCYTEEETHVFSEGIHFVCDGASWAYDRGDDYSYLCPSPLEQVSAHYAVNEDCNQKGLEVYAAGYIICSRYPYAPSYEYTIGVEVE